MVRRPPLSRRLRAMRGTLLLAGAWALALAGVVGLGLARTGGAHTGTAVVARHPVLAPESGRVATLQVVPGQQVRAGDALAVVEVPGLAQELARAEAEVRAEEEQVGLEGADRDRRYARDVDALRVRLLSAGVDLASEQAVLTGLEADLARVSAPGVGLSEAEVAAVRARRDAASAAATARQAELDGLERALAAAQARQGPEGGPGGALAAAQALRDGLRARLEGATLRAYADGVVDPTLALPGQWVQAGLPVVTLTEPASHEVVVFVAAGKARELGPGRAARVWPSQGEALPAQVHAVGPAVEAVPRAALRDPEVPEWGVPVTLRVATSLTPGERLTVEF